MTPTEWVNVTRVIDGDTVEVKTKPRFLRRSQTQRIRLYGIDAPESTQKGGPESTKHLKKLVGSGRKVWITRVTTDQYGRTVAVLYRKKGDPANSCNYNMVRAGHAHCYMLQPHDRAAYNEAETEARQKQRGLWKQSNPTIPRNYRQANRSKAPTSPWRYIAFLAAAVAAAWVLMHLYNYLAT